MPTYVYVCEKCEKAVLTALQGIHDQPYQYCPICGSKGLFRKPQPPTIVYRGPGFTKGGGTKENE